MNTTAQTIRPGRGPLHGIRVLDMTRVLSGPFCSMILGDLGAEIIKIEETAKGDSSRAVAPFANGASPVSHMDLTINRNKKSVAADVRTPKGRQIILDLAEHCDVLLENFRPDVMDRLGLSDDVLREVNPRLIHCSVTGFGRGNALSEKPSFDIIAQAMSGTMTTNGEPGGQPLKLGVSLGDLGAGMWAAIGVLAALQQRAGDDRGSSIDVSMLDSLMALQGQAASHYFVSGVSPPRIGNNSQSVVPYGMFPVQDGHIILALHIGSFWRKFCEAVGHPEWIPDPRFVNATARRHNREVLEATMSEVLRTKTAAEWARILDAADIPSSAVLDIGEALAQPIVNERKLVRSYEHPLAGTVRVVGSPLKFDGGFEDDTVLHAPLLGEHTTEVLKGLLRYTQQQVDQLKADGVIVT